MKKPGCFLPDLKVVDQETVKQSWFGLVLAGAEGEIWWSGSGPRCCTPLEALRK
jgi:hypothetical protein